MLPMTNRVVFVKYLKHDDGSCDLGNLAGEKSLSSSGAEATMLTEGMEAMSGLPT